MWCLQAKYRMSRLSLCSERTQAPFKHPVLDAVVSNTNAYTVLISDQSSSVSYTADEILYPVPAESSGTPRSCSVFGVVAKIGSLSTFVLPVISESIFESQWIVVNVKFK